MVILWSWVVLGGYNLVLGHFFVVLGGCGSF